jgi:hypothetical protein
VVGAANRRQRQLFSCSICHVALTFLPSAARINKFADFSPALVVNLAEGRGKSVNVHTVRDA